MSRTDLLLAAVLEELKSHQAEIDQYRTRSITICVKINQETGRPRAVIFTRETETDLTTAMLPVTV